mgnify:CR=1 FL=1
MSRSAGAAIDAVADGATQLVHTTVTRRSMARRKCLNERAVSGDSHGFDSHHPLQTDSETWKGPAGPFVKSGRAVSPPGLVRSG